jgi:hypothetical protein
MPRGLRVLVRLLWVYRQLGRDQVAPHGSGQLDRQPGQLRACLAGELVFLDAVRDPRQHGALADTSRTALAIGRAAVATIPPVRAIVTAVPAVTARAAIPAKTATPAVTASAAIPAKTATPAVTVRPTGPVTISPGSAWPVGPAAEAPGWSGRTRTERSSGGRPGPIWPVALGPVAGCPVVETAFAGAAIAGITRAVAEAIPAGAPARPAIS